MFFIHKKFWISNFRDMQPLFGFINFWATTVCKMVLLYLQPRMAKMRRNLNNCSAVCNATSREAPTKRLDCPPSSEMKPGTVVARTSSMFSYWIRNAVGKAKDRQWWANSPLDPNIVWWAFRTHRGAGHFLVFWRNAELLSHFCHKPVSTKTLLHCSLNCRHSTKLPHVRSEPIEVYVLKV